MLEIKRDDIVGHTKHDQGRNERAAWTSGFINKEIDTLATAGVG